MIGQRSKCGIMFSVVIPTHNRPLHLARALKSVAEQSVQDLEVIVVDDGSEPATDSSVLGDLVGRVVRNPRAVGPGAARNRGAAAASGEFIAFLDDDDSWVASKLALTRTCLRQQPGLDVVMHRAGWAPPVDAETGIESACVPLQDPVHLMLTRQPPHPSALVVRKSIHERIEFDETFPAAADLDYSVRLAEIARIGLVPLILTIHGDSEAQDSAISIQRRINGRLMFREKHREYFKNPVVEAFFLARLSHQYRRAGQRLNATTSAAKSLLARPTSLGMRALVAAAVPEHLVKRVARRRD
jgi:glycosyltransferase involved in cell wall biosynthesis